MGILDKVKGAVKALPKKLDEPAKLKMTAYEVEYAGKNGILKKRFKTIEEAEEFARKTELAGKKVYTIRKLNIEKTLRGVKRKEVLKEKVLKAAFKTVDKVASQGAQKSGKKRKKGKARDNAPTQSRKKELPSLLSGTPDISSSSPSKKKKKSGNLPKLI